MTDLDERRKTECSKNMKKNPQQQQQQSKKKDVTKILVLEGYCSLKLKNPVEKENSIC